MCKLKAWVTGCPTVKTTSLREQFRSPSVTKNFSPKNTQTFNGLRWVNIFPVVKDELAGRLCARFNDGVRMEEIHLVTFPGSTWQLNHGRKLDIVRRRVSNCIEILASKKMGQLLIFLKSFPSTCEKPKEIAERRALQTGDGLIPCGESISLNILVFLFESVV